ncbi:protein phosphatase PPM8, putative [Plasmodium malariae]|uniref:Protein phosphatase PPM8, putative n=1 Tax=Plasmodium malariae TaxID=5858 RepID=A0A1D3PCT4_PLAMA|nr:protein phosphatase PPM8, putative [Plasmodium malariae]SCN12868.1 protein phosphatase PPM8, putative [Plasmodium malariae]
MKKHIKMKEMRMKILSSISNLVQKKLWKKFFLIFLVVTVLAVLFDSNSVSCNESVSSGYNEHFDYLGSTSTGNEHVDDNDIRENYFSSFSYQLKYENLEEYQNDFFLHNNEKISMMQFASNTPIEDRCFVYKLDITDNNFKPYVNPKDITDTDDMEFVKNFEKNIIENYLVPPAHVIDDIFRNATNGGTYYYGINSGVYGLPYGTEDDLIFGSPYEKVRNTENYATNSKLFDSSYETSNNTSVNKSNSTTNSTTNSTANNTANNIVDMALFDPLYGTANNTTNNKTSNIADIAQLDPLYGTSNNTAYGSSYGTASGTASGKAGGKASGKTNGTLNGALDSRVVQAVAQAVVQASDYLKGMKEKTVDKEINKHYDQGKEEGKYSKGVDESMKESDQTKNSWVTQTNEGTVSGEAIAGTSGTLTSENKEGEEATTTWETKTSENNGEPTNTWETKISENTQVGEAVTDMLETKESENKQEGEKIEGMSETEASENVEWGDKIVDRSETQTSENIKGGEAATDTWGTSTNESTQGGEVATDTWDTSTNESTKGGEAATDTWDTSTNESTQGGEVATDAWSTSTNESTEGGEKIEGTLESQANENAGEGEVATDTWDTSTNESTEGGEKIEGTLESQANENAGEGEVATNIGDTSTNESTQGGETATDTWGTSTNESTEGGEKIEGTLETQENENAGEGEVATNIGEMQVNENVGEGEAATDTWETRGNEGTGGEGNVSMLQLDMNKDTKNGSSNASTSGTFQEEYMKKEKDHSSIHLEKESIFNDKNNFGNGGFIFAGVMDGHGGHIISDTAKRWLGFYIKKQLLQKLRKSNNNVLSPSDIVLSLEEAHVLLDKDILKSAEDFFFDSNVRFTRTGSCSLTVLIDKENYYVSNIGDSKGLLITKDKVVKLNNIHNASELSERIRLTLEHPNEDDVIMCKKHRKIGNTKVSQVINLTKDHLDFLHNDVGRCYVKGRLQCTRSFGDFYLKHKIFAFDFKKNRFVVNEPHSFSYITAFPEVIKIKRNPDDEYIVLMSDGVSDFLSDYELYDTIKQNEFSVEKASKEIIRRVLKKCAVHAGLSIKNIVNMPRDRRRKFFDDMSVVILKLK